MSLDTEFDFWSEEKLVARPVKSSPGALAPHVPPAAGCVPPQPCRTAPLPTVSHPQDKLVAALATRACDDSPTSDPRSSIPSEKDEPFWVGVCLECDLLDDADPDELPEGRNEQLRQIARELAMAIHSEMNGRDFVQVKPGLFLGDLSGPESRLAMRWLGITGVLTVASHAIERLWVSDGLSYHTAIVDASASSVGASLPAACAFLARQRCAFVCCASGQGLSVLMCAAHLATTARPASEAFAETPSEILKRLCTRREMHSDFPAAEREAFAAYCAARGCTGGGGGGGGGHLVHVSPRELEASEESLESDEDESEAMAAPMTPLNKPKATLGAAQLSAIDLVKVACAGPKRRREEEEAAAAAVETPATARATGPETPQPKLAGRGGSAAIDAKRFKHEETLITGNAGAERVPSIDL